MFRNSVHLSTFSSCFLLKHLSIEESKEESKKTKNASDEVRYGVFMNVFMIYIYIPFDEIIYIVSDGFNVFFI